MKRYGYAIALSLIFIALAVAMHAGATLPIDLAVRGAIHGFASHSLTRLVQWFSLVGSNPVWVTCTLLIALVLWLTARRRAALAIAVSMSGAVVLDIVLKAAFHRARPEMFFGTLTAGYSFPSGHALFAACFYGTLALLSTEIESMTTRIVIWLLALFTIFCIGLSRIYLGAHYPSDVLGGYLVGAAWLAFLDAAGTFQVQTHHKGKMSGET